MLPRLEAMHVDQFDPARDFTLPSLLHKSIFLRCHDDVNLENWLRDLPVHDWPILAGWPAMQALLATAHAMADPTAELGRAVLSVIDPGGWIQWHVDLGDYAKAHRRWHVPLITSFDCLCYARDETIRMAPGELVELDTQVPHGSGNWGTLHRTHLIFETRRGA